MIGIADAAPALRFSVLGTEPGHCAVPTLRLRLGAETEGDRAVRGLALTVHVQIAAERRRYDDVEVERLAELFGAPDAWSRSLGAVPWLHAALNVPEFAGATTIEVGLPCSYDFEVASAKYLAALGGGEIPVDVLLSGTMFYAARDGRLQVAKIPWDNELSARIPVAAWRAAVDAAFPGSAWLRIARETLGALQAYRSRHAFTSWDETFVALLGEEER
jgi:hypothetical protein